MNSTNDIFSYKSIRNSIQMFRSGVNSGTPEFWYDEPGYFFWKPLFYFFNGDSFDDGIGNGGLLYPSWINYKNDTYAKVEDTSDSNNGSALRDNKVAVEDAGLENSAYNYLMRNGELKRAQLLRNFITLLSDISSTTPWYFKEVSGLDEAVSKKTFFESPKIDETRKQITITCLSDSIDTRIGTMLDMYRSACYSWQTKREIVPANLRKFDMGIYVFTKPYNTFKKDITGVYKPLSVYDDPIKSLFNQDERTISNRSYKYLEFHNCEIDLESCKFGDTFSVESANTMEYKLVISYDNCYDNRYNDQFLGMIGDSIITDILEFDDLTTDTNSLPIAGGYGSYNMTNLTGINKYNGILGILSKAADNLIDSTIGVAKQAVSSAAKGLLLGNIYHGSIKNIITDIGQGRIIKGSADAVKFMSNPENITKPLGNLFGTIKSETTKNILTIHKPNDVGNKKLGGMYSESRKKMGELNQAKSSIKNI